MEVQNISYDKIKSASKYSSKYSWKLRQDFDLAKQAQDWLRDKNIHLPDSLMDFNANPDKYLLDEETGECQYQYIELIKMIYELRKCNKGVYAMFENPTGIDKQRISLLGAFHSKHRYSSVWNWKKSKLLRAKVKSYLIETKIHEKYRPMHLVLTVPHENGIWHGQKFYASEILKCFNFMRKYTFWQYLIHGGEYGLEVKKSKNGNGLHIHLHCLVFLKKNASINKTREYIQHTWNELTGANFIHFETLYVHKKDEKGNYKTEIIPELRFTNDSEDYVISEKKEVRKKFYLDNNQKWFRELSSEERLEAYVAGVMECIKYHFKHDCCEMANGQFDIDLINEILMQSKGLRFHAKFGALYGDKRLSLSSSAIENEELTDEELSSDIQGNAENAIKNILNPYTGETASLGEYKIVLSFPAKIDHLPNTDINPHMPIVRDKKLFFEVRNDLTLKEVIAKLAKNRYHELLPQHEYERYKLNSMSTSKIIYS